MLHKVVLNIYFTIILTLLVLAHSLAESQFDSVDSLVQKISENLDAYQVTIFINKSEKIIVSKQNIVFNKLMHLNPSIIIDISTFNNISKERYMQPKVTEKPTYTTLNVILINENSSDMEIEIARIQSFLDLLIQLSAALIRPKCLMLFFHRSSVPRNLFETTFKYVWRIYFLDFSIIEVNLSSNNMKNIIGYLHYFNPFFDTFIKKPYNSGTKIFIDKLENLNQYPIKLLLLNHTSFMKITTDKNGNIKVSGLYHDFLIAVLNKMNFKILYYISNITSSINSVLFKHSLNILSEGYVNMFSVAYSYITYDFPAIDIGYNGFESFVAIVPLETYTNIKIPYITITFLFFVPLFISFIIYIAYLMKIQKNRIDVFYVAQILYGISTTTHLQKWSDRIIFFSVVLISMQYSMNFFSKLVDDYMINDEVRYNDFKSIADSSLDIYINKLYYHYLNDDDKYIRKIKNRVKKVTDIYNCINLFKTSHQVICLTSREYADYTITSYHDDKSKPLMKIAQPIFAQEKLRFLFENYLPYSYKFKYLFLKLHQAGISAFLHKKGAILDHISTTSKKKNSSSKLLFLCSLILGIGCFSSLLTFLIEIMIFSLVGKNKFKRVIK